MHDATAKCSHPANTHVLLPKVCVIDMMHVHKPWRVSTNMCVMGFPVCQTIGRLQHATSRGIAAGQAAAHLLVLALLQEAHVSAPAHVAGRQQRLPSPAACCSRRLPSEKSRICACQLTITYAEGTT